MTSISHPAPNRFAKRLPADTAAERHNLWPGSITHQLGTDLEGSWERKKKKKRTPGTLLRMHPVHCVHPATAWWSRDSGLSRRPTPTAWMNGKAGRDPRVVRWRFGIGTLTTGLDAFVRTRGLRQRGLNRCALRSVPHGTIGDVKRIESVWFLTDGE